MHNHQMKTDILVEDEDWKVIQIRVKAMTLHENAQTEHLMERQNGII